MARGKVKYRDVVGKGQVKNRKSQKNKPKPRKTYSLYQNSKKNSLYQHSKKNVPKRKYNDNSHEINVKKQKIEAPPNVECSSESELEDDMTKLINTFGDSKTSNNKNSLAIDSSDSEIEEENKDDSVNSLSEEESETDDSLVSTVDEDNKSLEVPVEGVTKNQEDLGLNVSVGDSDLEDNADQDDIVLDTEKEEDMETVEDPFMKHLFYELHESLLESIQNIPISVDQYIENWPQCGKICIQIPKCDRVNIAQNNEFSISENITYAPQGQIPKKLNVNTIKPNDLCIKTQIINNLPKVNNSITANSTEMFTPLQAELFSVLNNYQDLYYPERTFSNAEEIRYVYCLHAVNHILKTRIKVIHHNAKLSKKDDVPEEFRDQGLVRPKVLIIVPFKDAAYKIIRMIIDLLLPEDKGNVMHKKRFVDDYTGNELILPKRNPKPEDYEQTFQGNTNDDFKMGITVTKKTIKLYADFYSSDIIVASPLGLRRVIGAEGEEDRDFDFLAGIELLILDQTEIFLMQNWDHIIHILNHMHLQPKDSHGTDFSRVRTWSLNGWAKYYRQTLIFASFVVPEINSLFNKKCLNYAGKIKIANAIQFGCISQVFVQIPHVFHRFDAQNPAEAIDARFDIFVKKILPQQKESLMKQTLVFLPNYFDYVRVRNYFKREDIGFVQICEYSKEGKIARARDMFYHGDAHFLLYTERYHFFNRKQIKGIRHLVFYQPPNFSHFYYEMCNLMQEANMNKKVGNMSNMTVTVIYSKYDVHQLAAIVGTERAAKMCQSERKVHMMVTGAD